MWRNYVEKNCCNIQWKTCYYKFIESKQKESKPWQILSSTMKRAAGIPKCATTKPAKRVTFHR